MSSNTIVNSAPLTILRGTQDLSTRVLPIESEILPTHLAKVYLFAQKGPLSPQLVVGNSRNQMYGDDTFDMRKQFATHQTVLSNALNAKGNAQMIERILPDDVYYKSNLLLCLDVLETDIVQYERVDGFFKLDADGLKIPSDADPIPGYSCKWIIKTVEYSDYYPTPQPFPSFGEVAISEGDRINGEATSTLYPILRLEASSFGSYFNDAGIRIWAPTIDTGLNESVVSSLNVYPFRMSVIRRTNPDATPSIVFTESNEPYFDFSFIDDLVNPATDAKFSLKDIFLDKYQNLKDTRFPLKEGDFGRIKIFNENISSLLQMFANKEMQSGEPMVDLVADSSWMLFNFINGKNSDGKPYYTFEPSCNDGDSIVLSENTNLFAGGGFDGSMFEDYPVDYNQPSPPPVSIDPTYTITPNSTSVNEGDSVIFTVNTTAVPDGTVLNISQASGSATGDDIILNETVVINNNIGTFNLSAIADDFTEGDETIAIQLIDSVSSSVVATSSLNTINDTSLSPLIPTYELLAPANMSEGDNIIFIVNTTSVPDGTILQYGPIDGTADASDFTTPLTGDVTINNNTGAFSLTAAADSLTEGSETIRMGISKDGIQLASDSYCQVNVIDTSLTPIVPTYTLTSVSSVDENSNIIFNVNTTNVPDGTVLNWARVSGSAIVNDFAVNPTGTVTINNNTGSFSVVILVDNLTEGTENFYISIFDSLMNELVMANPVTINDTSTTPPAWMSVMGPEYWTPVSFTWIDNTYVSAQAWPGDGLDATNSPDFIGATKFRISYQNTGTSSIIMADQTSGLFDGFNQRDAGTWVDESWGNVLSMVTGHQYRLSVNSGDTGLQAMTITNIEILK